MRESVRSRILWTIWMAGGGLVTAAVVYAMTGSLGWAVIGLVVSGIALNAIGQAVAQPMKAIRGPRDDGQTKHT